MHELPERPDPAVIARVRAVVAAGHRGDVSTARDSLADGSELVREAALGALARCGALSAEATRAAFGDPAARVRARAAELSVGVAGIDPSELLIDDDPQVVEVAAFACGEQAWPDGGAPVETLAAIATGHDDALCRESAAAALGAIGDPVGLEAVLAACNDRVTVRRRAVLALAAFEDERADEALERALGDKDWQVRQAAEDLLDATRSLESD